MGKTTGFLEYKREEERYAPIKERIQHYREFTKSMTDDALKCQGARCMDCGIPFCHSGCPLGNLIPDFNDAIYKGNWKKAARILHATNNFPEFTGRLCPAPCEEACVLGINADPVTIEQIEKNIVEVSFENGWIQAVQPKNRTEKKIAIVGSGPSGLAAAQQLNRAGHTVTVYERDKKVGGLLRYGIPDFKLEKEIIDRRIAILKEEGIIFKTNTHIGIDIEASRLKEEFDAVLLTTGATKRRTLAVPGNELKGVVQAMDFLKQSNERVDGQVDIKEEILATKKNVIVIGGGDTGSDCIGTSIRQNAANITNFEIMPKGSLERPATQPWPYWPMRLRTSTSHQEGGERQWSISTKKFAGDGKGNLKAIHTVEVAWKKENEKWVLKEIPNTEKEWKCDLVLLALGFTGSETVITKQLGIEMGSKETIGASEKNYKTNIKGVFTAGDARRGQSLIVWAISEGRQAAYHIDTYLMGTSKLPLKGDGDLPRVN